MKTSVFISLIVFITFISCTNSNYETPIVEITEPDLSSLQKTTFSAIQSAYKQAIIKDTSANFVTFDDDIYIVGYVVSNDASGNFFEELMIQNTNNEDDISDENRRMGIKLNINTSSLYQYYEFGRKVYVKLNGLSAGIDSGILTLGMADGTEIGQIGLTNYSDFVLISTEVADITPKEIDLTTINEIDMNTYVQVSNVQFIKNQITLTFAGEAIDEFDAERTLESCINDNGITLLTSTFSDFKSLPLPIESGTINGILTKNFFGDTNVFKINSFSDIDFQNERCDPIAFDCGLAVSEGSTILFEDDFETQASSAPVSGNGWMNYIQEGTERFETFVSTTGNVSFENSRTVTIGSFNSGDTTSIAWLITPEIDLEANENVTFSFVSSNSFADGSELEVLIASDWDGTEENILAATWGELSAATIVSDEDFFVNYARSGIVDLSCLTGTVHIAFRYTGSGNPDFDGAFEIDNVAIKSN